MSKLKWDQIGERLYETGVDHGVLYPQVDGAYPKGYVWNGLTSVASNPSGAEETKHYADNMKYFGIRSAEEFGLTIGCFMYPDEFKQCNGETEPVAGVTFGQQYRNSFGFSYRTKIGNDTGGQDYGFKIHCVYGCSVSPSSLTYNTMNESPEPGEMSYETTTTPVDVSGKGPDGKPFKPVAEITFNSTTMDSEQIAKVEAILYGTNEDNSDPDNVVAATEPRLPLPDEWITILAEG